MEKKKNSKRFIIPPSYFKSKGITPIPVSTPSPQRNLEEKKVETSQPEVKEEKAVSIVEEPKVDILIGKSAKRSSGLSLSSIKKKKEHLIKQMDVVIDEEDLPNDAFTEEQLVTTWNAYTKQLEANGEKIMASILQMDTPKLKDNAICIELSNSTLKVELERAQYPLMKFIRKELNNYSVKLDISVNEEIEKKYAFTTQEKYEKLKEKNPNIELLKKAFGLDV